MSKTTAARFPPSLDALIAFVEAHVPASVHASTIATLTQDLAPLQEVITERRSLMTIESFEAGGDSAVYARALEEILGQPVSGIQCISASDRFQDIPGLKKRRYLPTHFWTSIEQSLSGCFSTRIHLRYWESYMNLVDRSLLQKIEEALDATFMVSYAEYVEDTLRGVIPDRPRDIMKENMLEVLRFYLGFLVADTRRTAPFVLMLQIMQRAHPLAYSSAVNKWLFLTR